MDGKPHNDNQFNLAGDPRVYFAAERTMLAWIRTGLALMGFGFVVARFGLFLREWAMIRGVDPIPAPRQPSLSLGLGTAMVILGILVNVLASLRHARFVREFSHGLPPTLKSGRTAIILAWLMAMLGVIIAAYLVLLSV